MQRNYRAKADLDFNVEGVPSYELKSPNRVWVNYRVTFTEAEWGISDYWITFTDPIEFEYELQGKKIDAFISVNDLEKVQVTYWEMPPLDIPFISITVRKSGGYKVEVVVGDVK